MKRVSTLLVLKCVVVCFLLFNIGLLFLNQLSKEELASIRLKLDHMESVALMYEVAKETTLTGFKYEQRRIEGSCVYIGSDDKTLIPFHSIVDRPKLVIGLNQNMCRPCVEGAFNSIQEVFPDFKTNPDIICIADVEQRFKDDYYGKKVVSFSQKEFYPLYEIKTKPYFFVLDKDLCVKCLFITDQVSPELTIEYLKIIKERYMSLDNIELE